MHQCFFIYLYQIFSSMSKFQEALVTYQSDMKNKLKMADIDENLLKEVTRGLGPTIYKKETATVACSDQSERDTIRKNFLIKKLGLADGPELDAAIAEVCQQMGTSNRQKHRAIFYYLLVKKFNMESFYSKG